MENVMSESSIGRKRIYLAMQNISAIPHIAETLGIKEITSMSDEFWQAQQYAVRRRFFLLCLQTLGLPLDTDSQTIDDRTANYIADIAEDHLRIDNFNYTTIRTWYKNRGQFEFNKAMKLKHERQDIAGKVLRVLVIFNNGGAKYLAYSNTVGMVLTDIDNAHQFAIDSVSETSKSYLLEMAKNFTSLLPIFDAKEIKVLVGHCS